MPSYIKETCNTCKHGIPHEDFPAFQKCGRIASPFGSDNCITENGREYWEPSYKAMAESLEEFERCQGIKPKEFLTSEEMEI